MAISLTSLVHVDSRLVNPCSNLDCRLQIVDCSLQRPLPPKSTSSSAFHHQSLHTTNSALDPGVIHLIGFIAKLRRDIACAITVTVCAQQRAAGRTGQIGATDIGGGAGTHVLTALQPAGVHHIGSGPPAVGA